MKKTAIHKLVDWINEYDTSKMKDTKPFDDIMILINDELIELERTQIETALNEGISYANSPYPQTFDYPASRYYHYTYGDSKIIENLEE